MTKLQALPSASFDFSAEPHQAPLAPALSRRDALAAFSALSTLSAAGAALALPRAAAAAEPAAAAAPKPAPVLKTPVPAALEKAVAASQARAKAFADAHPLALRTMGSFMFGGTSVVLPSGETFHGEHGYAEYFVPERAKTLPLIFWHGIGQSGKCFESTPDGREGFSAVFPRLGWAAYVIDQPRRGRAGYTQTKPLGAAVPATAMETAVWHVFRNGPWLPGHDAELFPNAAFPATPAGVDQFFRQQTPDTGAEPATREHRCFMAKTMTALLERTGPAVLVTHSNSGQYGWETLMANGEAVRAVIALEPGAFAFPESAAPAPVETKNDFAAKAVGPQIVPDADFEKLLKRPILVVYGDNIAEKPAENFNEEAWRLCLIYAKQFVAEVRRRGGDAELIHLPDLGIRGNTHALYADLNSLNVAKVLADWLAKKGLDGSAPAHEGPAPQRAVGYTIPIRFGA